MIIKESKWVHGCYLISSEQFFIYISCREKVTLDEMNGWCVSIVVDKPFDKLDFYNAIPLYSYNNNPRGDCPSTLSPSEPTSVCCYFLHP